MSLVLHGTDGVTFNDSSLQGAAASPFGLKNRIINGAMVIDQRNAGASVNPGSDEYTLDRWFSSRSQSSKFTVQQNAGSVTPPAGFTYYLGVTSSSAYSLSAGDFFGQAQRIEGFNVADFDFGKATAKTITLSFWVRSSLTGSFGASVGNSAANRQYPFSYTISSANTWEYKTVTIPGDTTGTWLTTNGVGMLLYFSLGMGSNFSGTANAWVGSGIYQPTGSTSVVGTNGATWYVTGVQLEIGSTATPFERRLYNQELANCCRYYWQDASVGIDTPYADTTYNTAARQYFVPVVMRVVPTITQTGSVLAKNNIGSATTFNQDVGTSGTNQFNFFINATGTARTYLYRPVQFSAEL